MANTAVSESLKTQIADALQEYKLSPERFEIAYARALEVAAKPGPAANPATVAYLGIKRLLELEAEAAEVVRANQAA